MEQLGIEAVGVALAALGVVMYANRAGYLYFVVHPRTVLFLAGIGTVMAWSYAHAETNIKTFPVLIKTCSMELIFKWSQTQDKTLLPAQSCLMIGNKEQFLCTKNNGCVPATLGKL